MTGLRNETYKHLEEPIRIMSLTVGQFVLAAGGLVVAIWFGLYVSPLPPKWTLGLCVFFGLLPTAIAKAMSGADSSPVDALKAMAAWLGEPKHYRPGASEVTVGYVVEPPVAESWMVPARSAGDVAAAMQDVQKGWDE